MNHFYTFALGALIALSASAKPVNIKPSSVTDWASIGECEFCDDMLFNKTKKATEAYRVKVDESSSHPGFYRIVNPYGKGTPLYGKVGDHVLDTSKDHYIYINAVDPEAVFIPTSDLRMAEEWDDWGETSLAIMSKGYYNGVVDEYGYSSLEEQAELGHMGTLEDGYITFPLNEILLCEGDYRWGGEDANLSGNFYLKLPGAKNYRVSGMYVSTYCAAAKESVGWMSIGGASEQAYFDFAQTTVTDADIASVVANGQPLIEDLGYGDFYVIYGAVFGEKMLARDTRNTKHIGIVVTVDKDKKVKKVYTKDSYNMVENNNQWTPLGKGKFTDAVLSGFYGDKKPVTYDVDVESDPANPARYRIVNPYGEAHPGFEAGFIPEKHAGHKHYIYINASDPDAVILEEGPLCVAYGNNGEARISSVAAQSLAKGSTIEQVKASKKAGKLENNKITFPKKALLFAEKDYIEGNWRTADNNGKTVLELPSTTGIENIIANDGETEYFNLQGIRVENPESGIYIRRKGNVTDKVIIR